MDQSILSLTGQIPNHPRAAALQPYLAQCREAVSLLTGRKESTAFLHLVLAVITHGSQWDPHFSAPDGRYGLMQLTDTTFVRESMRLKAHYLSKLHYSPDSRTDSRANILIGAYYLQTLLLRNRLQLPAALRAYRWGSLRDISWDSDPKAAHFAAGVIQIYKTIYQGDKIERRNLLPDPIVA